MKSVQALESLVEYIIDEGHSAADLVERLVALKVAREFKNWGALLVAEGCRRRGEMPLAIVALEECENQMLRDLCDRWFARFL